MKVLVTGGTGFIGSHLVDRLREAGDDVRVLARPSSDTAELRARGVEIVTADLAEPGDLGPALRDIDLVHHLAARVSDWGRWSDFAAVAVAGTERLLRAAANAGVSRFVLMSSASVYGLRRMRGRTVTEAFGPSPRPSRWDAYGRTKIASETLTLACQGALEVAVLRPTLVYGPRDRVVLPRLAGLLRSRRLRLVGSGTNRMHLVYVGDVVEAAFRAGTEPVTGDGVYHLDGPERIDQRDFLTAIAELVGAPTPRPGPPLELAYAASFLAEVWGHARRRREPPARTRYLTALLGGEACFDTRRAECELGWKAQIGFEEGFGNTAAWWRADGVSRPSPSS